MSHRDLATDEAEHPAPPGDRDVLRAVARLATLATTSFDPDDALHELCRAATSLLDVDGVGAMGVAAGRDTGARARMVHADACVDRLERLQEALWPLVRLAEECGVYIDCNPSHTHSVLVAGEVSVQDLFRARDLLKRER